MSLLRKGGFVRFSIDRGGTFTDIYCEYDAADRATGYKIMKLLSVSPEQYPDAPREGIRRLLEGITGEVYPPEVPVKSSNIQYIRMGTTVATNALLERKGDRTALVVTAGFKDVLNIGNQSRPKIFDLSIQRPSPIVEVVVEAIERVRVLRVDEKILGEEGQEEGQTEGGKREGPTSSPRRRLVRGVTGEYVEVLTPLNEEVLRADLKRIHSMGITALAVSLVHSYTFPEHERVIRSIASEIGFQHISCSSEVMPSPKLVPRTFTACADAYLTPCIRTYLNQFIQGFDAAFLNNVQLLFMQSDGGLVPLSLFNGFRSVLSGPAGGVVGYSQTSYHNPYNYGDDPGSEVQKQQRQGQGQRQRQRIRRRMPVIGFDMGGTSTDVSRYAGQLEHIFENTTAGVIIQAPQLDINTVAAGGGSILFFNHGLFVVGPESASAHPGPACYRKGGPLTVTDANLLLGRVNSTYFPRIFGPNQDMPLDGDITRIKFEAMKEDINRWYVEAKKRTEEAGAAITDGAAPATVNFSTAEDVALGFIDVANEAMCRPIRALTEARGHDISQHVLACFGAAGAQHACAIAENLGIARVHIHRFSGILSAYGMCLADVVMEEQIPTALAIPHHPVLSTPSPLSLVSSAPSAIVRTIMVHRRTLVQKLTARLNMQGVGSFPSVHSPPHVGVGGPACTESGGSPESGAVTNRIVICTYVGLRYEGTDTTVMVAVKTKKKRQRDNWCESGVRGKGEDEADEDEVEEEDSDDEEEGDSTGTVDTQSPEEGIHIDSNGAVDSLLSSSTACAAVLHGLVATFRRRYQKEFGFALSRAVLVDCVRVRAISKSIIAAELYVQGAVVNGEAQSSSLASVSSSAALVRQGVCKPMDTVRCYLKTLSSQTHAVSAPFGAAGAGAWCDVCVYNMAAMSPGDSLLGPCMLVDGTSTVVVDPRWRCSMERDRSLVLRYQNEAEFVKAKAKVELGEEKEIVQPRAPLDSCISYDASAPHDEHKNAVVPMAAVCDPILLSVFSHRFMSIAEQMGRALQRTSISTNIKERLDFSCAIFGPDGALVANAPHLPVHLGAMQEAVKYQIQLLRTEAQASASAAAATAASAGLERDGQDIRDRASAGPSGWNPGDVVIANHPQAGGSHLPDITVITPVFSDDGKGNPFPVFFVACRGHHADIGGISPGSMPPFSKHLNEEGAAIESFKLVKQGQLDEAGIVRILTTPNPDPFDVDGAGIRDAKKPFDMAERHKPQNHSPAYEYAAPMEAMVRGDAFAQVGRTEDAAADLGPFGRPASDGPSSSYVSSPRDGVIGELGRRNGGESEAFASSICYSSSSFSSSTLSASLVTSLSSASVSPPTRSTDTATATALAQDVSAPPATPLVCPSSPPPRISGTRNLEDNLSDLRAQVAANTKGIALMNQLICEKSLSVVQQYMRFIMDTAERSVRAMLCDLSKKRGLNPVGTLQAEDHMDDGSIIAVSITIDRRNGRGDAVFDFTGTSAQVYGNTNAPRAVTYSAVIYCLRCLLKGDIPLNQGCLNGVQIRIPERTILNPTEDAAVVGGNVLTSQRVTDVILKAFGVSAASQGCMNNLTFGNESFGYYETIAGGAGAGPTWHGQSGVHTHMTNTRITDVEIIERRYPVLVRKFSLRQGSGGNGLFRGGDGVERDIEFLVPLTVGILSERRAFRPFGLHGGEAAQPGFNYIITKAKKDPHDGSAERELKINLGGKNTFHAQRGDRIVILTPGGGGYGAIPSSSASSSVSSSASLLSPTPSSPLSAASSLHERGGGSLANYVATQETS